MQYTSHSIKKLAVDSEKGTVQIDLETSTIVNGEVTDVVASSLSFTKGDNISSQPAVVQKACNDAWAEAQPEA